MSNNHVGTYTLPNVYFDRIIVGTELESYDIPLGFTATVTKTTFDLDLCLIDYTSYDKNVFSARNIFNNFMEINVSIITDMELINRINSGELLIDDIACKKYKLNEFLSNIEGHPSNSDMIILKNSVRITINSELPENIYVYAFCSMNIEDMEKQLLLDLDFANNKFMRGPLSSECVLHNGLKRPAHTYHKISDGSLWAGPVSIRMVNDEEQIRGGPFAQANSPLLERRSTENNKIIFARSMPIGDEDDAVATDLPGGSSVGEADTAIVLNTGVGITLGTTAPTGIPTGAQLTNPNLSLAERFLEINRLLE